MRKFDAELIHACIGAFQYAHYEARDDSDAVERGVEAVLNLLVEDAEAATLATMDEVGVDEPVHHDEIDKLLVATVCQHFTRRLLRVMEEE